MTDFEYQYDKINSLEDYSFVAGATFSIEFEVFEESTGLPVASITSGSAKWVLFEYGNPDKVILTKTGIFTGTNKFKVSLTNADTVDLSGIYVQQPSITDFNGDIHTSQQGLILIVPSGKNRS
jgi:hypothetical protein